MFIAQKTMLSYLHTGRASDLENPKDHRLYRMFEIMPGLSAWLTLLLVIILSFFIPTTVAIFIIVFDSYWLIKTLYLSFHLRSAYRQLRQNLPQDWLKKLETLRPEDYSLPSVTSWRDIHHFVFLPIYNEDVSIVRATLEGLISVNYPKDRMAVVLCWEERGGAQIQAAVGSVKAEYANRFFKFIDVMHPDGLVGEQRGKGSNTAYAADFVKREVIDSLGLNPEHILVSNFDIDTIAYPQYFALLTHTFLTVDQPLNASYQPIPFYVNNIWEAPSFARVVAFSSTFWHTIKQERYERASTFSSHSMPWPALVKVGFWQRNMVSEDSRIFWQCFIQYDGNYRVQPLFYPVSMDANVAPSTWQTFRNVYIQQRRWAYGSENIPYLLYGLLRNRAIPWTKKVVYAFNVIEGNHSWATNALIIFFLGWLPVIVGGSAFNETVLSFNLPYITRWIMTASMVGLITSAAISITILPPKPPHYGRHRYLWMVLQWILFPITTIFLGSFPALDAQTRLALGKYMGFWVTPKFRK